MASTNGVIVRYWARSVNAVRHDCTNPITKPAISVTHSDRSWPMSAAASAGMTRKVRPTMSRLTRLDRRSPAAPHTSPEPNHAAASTRRTGTPSMAVISRSLASARMAVPVLLTRRYTAVPAVTRIGKTTPMIWVQLTRTPPRS